MLSIQRSSPQSTKCTPNLLPCRIEHSGPVNAAGRYWQPEDEGDDTQTAYFRGRKLRGRKHKLPDGYRGAILTNTPKVLSQPEIERDAEPDDEGEDGKIQVGVMEEIGEFDEVVVWGHEVAPDETEDPYAKGISEWISFAEAIHSSPVQKDASDAPR